MKCTNHKKVDANATCVGCGNFFCSDCLVKVKGKNYCKDCIAEQLENKANEKENESKSDKQSNQPQIIIQQQQQQSSVISDSGKPRGSWCWLIFWIFVFFPVAIIYWFMRRWD